MYTYYRITDYKCLYYVDRHVRYLHILSTNMPHIECQSALMVEGTSAKGLQSKSDLPGGRGL